MLDSFFGQSLSEVDSMTRIFSLLVFCPLLTVAADDRNIESLETISDLGELCEFYTPNGTALQLTSGPQAYRAGLCMGFVKGNVESWLRTKYKDCGTTPGVSLGPVFAAIRKTYRLASLRDPDQESGWFSRSASNLLDEAVFDEWDKKLDGSDCPLFIDDQLTSTADND